MKVHALILSPLLGAVLAAAASAAAPGQPVPAKPANKAATGTLVLTNTAETDGLYLKLQPGTLPEVVAQLQEACKQAAVQKGESPETAAENLRQAQSRVAQAQAKGDTALENENREVSKAQAAAEEAKAAAKGRVDIVRAGADAAQADAVYQRLATLAEKKLTSQQELEDAKAKRDAARAVVNAMAEESDLKAKAQAELDKAEGMFAELKAVVAAEREVAAAELRKAWASVRRYQMPNLTYGPGTSEVKVSAALDLTNVQVVQALALIAAAANCDLNPIYAPPQEGDEAGQRIVGYGFELSSRRASSSMPPTFALNVPASHPAPGETGEPVPKPLPSPAVPMFFSPTGSDAGAAKATAETDMNAPVVRIYAFGLILDRAMPEEERLKNEAAFKEVVQEALNLAGAPSMEKLYFHAGAGVLIAKASPYQQEIIEQAVSAMKESDRSVNPSRGTPLPQTKPPKP